MHMELQQNTSKLMSRRSFAVLLGAAAVVGGATLAGCSSASSSSNSSDSSAGSDGETTTFTTEAEERDLWGSADACTVNVGLILGPPSMGLSQFMLAAEEGLTENTFEFSVEGMDYTGLVASFNQGTYDICTLPSNIGPILYNNEELKNEYRVISVNNLGLLYVMTTDASIESFDDLAGRTVYSYGESGTPEYTIEALVKKLGLGDSFNVEFKSSPLEVINMMQEVENCVAILPQPFVSLSKTLVEDLYTPLDITVEWDSAFSDTGSQAITTTTIVNKEFLEEHEQAVIEYLNLAGESVSWTLDNMQDAAALQESLGTFLNNDVALDAMPYISMVNLTGTEMRTALSGFLQELYESNSESIGGALPGEEFYYLPPVGALDEAYLQAGLEEATEHKSATQDSSQSSASKEEAQDALQAFSDAS